MSAFVREFPVYELGKYRAHGGIAELFKHWVLPGEDGGAHGLRLAIRNGYLNFYVKGQSVAELRFTSSAPKIKIHRKYKEGFKKGDERATKIGQAYVTVRGDELQSVTASEVLNWIETAETYAGDEKRFVDDLVAVTPGVIDLEMALPADESAEAGSRVAPRMDMVVAQGAEIAFWEAKCATNGELRAKSEHGLTIENKKVGPAVVWQLLRYVDWINRGERIDEVRGAYVDAAQRLLAMAELFGKKGPAVACWRRLSATGDQSKLILPPGVVVAGYCSPRLDGDPREQDVKIYTSRMGSFAPHEDKLRALSIPIHIVSAKPENAILPDLRSGEIRRAELAA